jgi:hypothetical protein
MAREAEMAGFISQRLCRDLKTSHILVENRNARYFLVLITET